MDPKIQRLKVLIDKYLNKSRGEIYIIFGSPSDGSDQEVWFYTKYRLGIFRDEIAFVFHQNKICDIVITEYFLWKELRNIFYYEGQNPQYKIIEIK